MGEESETPLRRCLDSKLWHSFVLLCVCTVPVVIGGLVVVQVRVVGVHATPCVASTTFCHSLFDLQHMSRAHTLPTFVQPLSPA